MQLSSKEIEERISDSYELPNRVFEAVPEPVITVRTSAYQHGNYIRKCLEGVLMQKTSFPFEFIIGEDYSTDGTREIVFEYAKKYPDIIRVITAEHNVGMKANGFRCRIRARGKYMALCEGDDYWTDPGKIQKQVYFLESNPDYAAVFTNAYFVNEINNTTKKYVSNLIEGEVKLEDIIQIGGYIYPTASIMYRNDCYDISLTNPGLAGDTFLILNLALNGKIYFMDHISCIYRRWKGGVYSSKKNDKDALVKLKKQNISGYLDIDRLTEFKYHSLFKRKISSECLTILQIGKGTDNLCHIRLMNLKDILKWVNILIVYKLKSMLKYIRLIKG